MILPSGMISFCASDRFTRKSSYRTWYSCSEGSKEKSFVIWPVGRGGWRVSWHDAIPQPAGLLLLAQQANEQIGEKAGTQGLNWLGCQGGKPARERRARRQAATLKERHEGASPESQPSTSGCEGPYATEGEDGHKVEHLEVPEAAAGKADLFTDSIKDTLLQQMEDQERDFLEYVIMPSFLIVWHVGLDIAAILAVVFHPLPSNRSSRACFCPGALR